MFTGIVQEVGKVVQNYKSGDLWKLTIGCQAIQNGLKQGASISCNGICLTVTSFNDNSLSFSVMAETVKKTTFSNWSAGRLINLERALTLQSGLDGHIVQGHVDCITEVSKVSSKNKTTTVKIALPENYSHLIVAQGSIAINGVSLTVSDLEHKYFSVSLVDFTLTHTNLNALKPGDKINLEFDVLGKYVARQIAKVKEKATIEKLLYETDN